MGGRTGKAGSEELSALLKQRREILGLSRRELAEATGLSYPYISQLETGYRMPSSKAMQALALVLHVDPAELFDALPLEGQTIPRGSPQESRGRRSAPTESQYLANPMHSGPGLTSPVRPQRDAVRTAVTALRAVPPSQRLEALNQVQAEVLASLVDERE